MTRAISGRTAVYGLIGYPVGHSLSPGIHNAAFAALDLDGCYVAFPVEPARLTAALDGARALGVRGLNVTVPHKEAALAWANAQGAQRSSGASAIGAINTLAFDADGTIRVKNTDGVGFLRSLRDAGFDPAGRAVVLLGAGGAARAAAWTLLGAGARVVVYNRTPGRAERLVADLLSLHPRPLRGTLAAAGWAEARAGVAAADLVVNTTPVGMAPDVETTPIEPAGLFRPGQVVYDMVYRPAETRLLRAARTQGATTVNGLSMLIYQAAVAFQFWTGVEPPLEAMWRAALAELGEGDGG